MVPILFQAQVDLDPRAHACYDSSIHKKRTFSRLSRDGTRLRGPRRLTGWRCDDGLWEEIPPQLPHPHIAWARLDRERRESKARREAWMAAHPGASRGQYQMEVLNSVLKDAYSSRIVDVVYASNPLLARLR